jgi:hypothetical protein
VLDHDHDHAACMYVCMVSQAVFLFHGFVEQQAAHRYPTTVNSRAEPVQQLGSATLFDPHYDHLSSFRNPDAVTNPTARPARAVRRRLSGGLLRSPRGDLSNNRTTEHSKTQHTAAPTCLPAYAIRNNCYRSVGRSVGRSEMHCSSIRHRHWNCTAFHSYPRHVPPLSLAAALCFE